MSRFEDLSDRQAECLRLLGGGLNAKQIAVELNLSYETVNAHLKAARRILGVGRSVDAARLLMDSDNAEALVAGPKSVGTHPMVIATAMVSEPLSVHQVSPADRTVDHGSSELRETRTEFRAADIPFAVPRRTKGRLDDLTPIRRAMIVILAMIGCVVTVAGLAAIAGSLQAILWALKTGH